MVDQRASASQSDDRRQSDKGKGRVKGSAALANHNHSEDGAPKTSLLRSALGGTSDLPPSLAGILSSQGKAGVSSSSFAQHLTVSSLPSEYQLSSASSASSASQEVGPRPGFRTLGPTSQQQPGLISPFHSLSPTELGNFDSASYGSFEALDRGLHDVVRGQHLSSSSFESSYDTRGERRTSHDPHRQLLPSTDDLLDPTYHEAWARSIPSAMTEEAVQSSSALASEQEEASLVQAWEKALHTRRDPPSAMADNVATGSSTGRWWSDSEEVWKGQEAPAPRTAEQGGFMELLAAEEAAEERERLSGPLTASDGRTRLDDVARDEKSKAVEEAEAYEPPPEPLHAIQSTDPREALSFLIGSSSSTSSNDTHAKLRTELEDLKSRLEADAETAKTNVVPSRGMDRTARRVQRHAQLVRIEYDLDLLQGRLGYHEEVHGPYAAASYASPPDLSQWIDEAGVEGEALQTEGEMDQRRKRAIERLERLRRHVDAKL